MKPPKFEWINESTEHRTQYSLVAGKVTLGFVYCTNHKTWTHARIYCGTMNEQHFALHQIDQAKKWVEHTIAEAFATFEL
jgi:hypothetical protein